MDPREKEQQIKKRKKRRRIIIGLVVVVAIIIVVFMTRGGSEPDVESIIVERGELIQEVSVTGRVVPADSVSLAFQRSGKVSRVQASVGDVVSSGEILAQLNAADLFAQLREAQANEAVQQAKLDELHSGTRPEDIAVKEAELNKAEQDLSNDYDDVLDTLEDAFATADDAVHVKAASLFSGTKGTSYQVTFTTCSNADEIAAESARLNSENALESWRSDLNSLGVFSDRNELDGAMNDSDVTLKIVRSMLENVNAALSSGCVINDSTLDDERALISSARTNVSVDLTAISTLQQKIASQKLTVARIQNELSLKRAGSTPETIRAQEATVQSAQARVQSAQAEIAKTYIRSPFSGVVTLQGAQVGEIVAANTPLVSLISESQFEIEVSIPEVDITKISEGDLATVTLDAYGDSENFPATVVEIEPAEQILDGVPVYDISLQFVDSDNRIRSGMTANIDIRTDERTSVIAIPSRAVVTRSDGTKMVRLMNADETLREVTVETGLRGSDGRVEILTGINEGDNIVTFYSVE